MQIAWNVLSVAIIYCDELHLECVFMVTFSSLQYELLDEMMDFGYPQYTEAKILSEFIKTDAYRMEVTQRPPMAVTNAVSWRMEGIKYKKNEVGVSTLCSLQLDCYCIELYILLDHGHMVTCGSGTHPGLPH